VNGGDIVSLFDIHHFMTKRYLTLLSVLCFVMPHGLIAQTWLWANGAGSQGYDYSRQAATDKWGNAYITGEFPGDSISFGTTTLYNPNPGTGRREFFLTKYNSAGAVKWVRGATIGMYDEAGTSVATDSAGNVYVAGYYQSDSVRFGGITVNHTIPGWRVFLDKDIFLAKYDTAGTLLWVRNFGTRFDDAANSVAVDPSGNVYITGYFSDDSIQMGGTTLINTSPGYSADVFLAKFNPSGALIWAKKAGGYLYDEGAAVTTDRSGNVFVSGKFTSDTFFTGSGYLVNDTVGTFDMFVMGYSSTGSLLWAKRAGAKRDDIGCALAADSVGNVYVGGQYKSMSIQFGSTVLTKAASVLTSDIFLVKYSPGGSVLWAKRAGNVLNDYMSSVVLDTLGYVFISGESHYNTGVSAWFDTLELYNGGGFFAKYDPVSGAALQVHRVPLTTPYIAIDRFNGIYVTSAIVGASMFDAISVPCVGMFDAVIAKTYDTCAPPLLYPIGGPSAVCTGDSVVLFNAVSGGMWSVSNSFYATVSASGIVKGLVPGVVTITYLKIRGCGAANAVTKTVSINVSPAAGTLSGGSTVCVGQTTTLTASVTGGTWSTPGANVSVSSGGVVTGVAAGLGLVSYTVTNSCGSVAATKMLTVIPAADCPAQTELPVPQGDVRVFPNPAKDILHVQLPDGVSVANIVITDLPGRTLKSAGISSASATVSLAGIPAGVYILSIEAGGQTTRTKFLISE
jgi:hypothetical protein